MMLPSEMSLKKRAGLLAVVTFGAIGTIFAVALSTKNSPLPTIPPSIYTHVEGEYELDEVELPEECKVLITVAENGRLDVKLEGDGCNAGSVNFIVSY